jgi:hypothetical protein
MATLIPGVRFKVVSRVSKMVSSEPASPRIDSENKQRKRRVPSVYHGLVGTKREGLILKGFLRFWMVHACNENITPIVLKSLAIPAGFEPATHGVEIRYSIGVGTAEKYTFSLQCPKIPAPSAVPPSGRDAWPFM